MKAKITSRGMPVVLKSVNTMEERVQDLCKSALAKTLDEAVTISKREYLSGPRPDKLNVITRRLRNSMAYKVEVLAGRGVLGRFGNNVRYARYHEFGFQGQQQVRAHKRLGAVHNAKGETVEVRRALKDDQGNFVAWKETKLAAFARVLKRKSASSLFAQPVNVEAHTRNVNYAGRPYAKPALLKVLPKLLERLKDGLKRLGSNLPHA